MMKNKLLLIVTIFFITNTFAQNSKIVVNVTGIKNDKGVIKFGLFDKSEGFPDMGKEIKGKLIDAKTTGVSYTFEDVKPGTYAVAAVHDENEDGELDTNFFGIPTEQYGFSRNIYGTLGPPSFKDVSFKVEAGKIVKITINY